MRLTKKILALTLLLVPCFSAWTDDAEKADNVETKPREGQRTVVIAEADYDYDLNPQTASYTTEAQVLTGLFEGLFSYNPVNLEPEYALNFRGTKSGGLLQSGRAQSSVTGTQSPPRPSRILGFLFFQIPMPLSLQCWTVFREPLSTGPERAVPMVSGLRCVETIPWLSI